MEIVVVFTPRPLFHPQRKSPRYPLDRRLGGPQSRSGPCEVEKNRFASAENRTPVVQSVSVAVPTEHIDVTKSEDKVNVNPCLWS
jgi:hypothetical protein